MTEAQLAEIRKVEQEAGAAQNSIDHMIEAARPLDNTVLVEALERALTYAQNKGLAAENQLEAADALPEHR